MFKLPPLKGVKTVFLAVGNDCRADDAFGPLLLKELLPFATANFILYDGGQMPESLTSSIKKQNPQILIIADAAAFGAQAGMLKIIDGADIINPALSTHNLPLSMMINFIKQDCPNLQVIFIAAQIECTDFGKEPCPQILSAVKQAAAAIKTALA